MARWFMDHSAHRGIPSVSLRQLLSDAWFPGSGDLLVSGCSSDARRLEPGEVYVAVESADHDGHDDVELALERGAAAVVVERPSPQAGRLQVVVPDTRKALGALAHALAGEPSERLALSAFCGTTGADAASTFLRSILEASGQRVGMIGSTEWTDGQSVYPLRTTELSPPELAGLLGRMIDRRCASALFCVTRKGMEDGSAESLIPSETVVLNVRAPGMDADEVQAARRVFSKLARSVVPTGTVIVNADDPDAELLGGVHLDARRVTFSLKGNGEVSGRIDRLDSQGTRLTLSGFGGDFAVELRPAGRLAVEAAVAAAAVAWSRGIDRESVILGLEAVSSLKGRLEPIALRDGVDVRLEYPRSEADLARSLESMREWVSGEITCVVNLPADDGLGNSLVEVARPLSDRVVNSLDWGSGLARAESPELAGNGGLAFRGAGAGPTRRRSSDRGRPSSVPGRGQASGVHPPRSGSEVRAPFGLSADAP